MLQKNILQRFVLYIANKNSYLTKRYLEVSYPFEYICVYNFKNVCVGVDFCVIRTRFFYLPTICSQLLKKKSFQNIYKNVIYFMKDLGFELQEKTIITNITS